MRSEEQRQVRQFVGLLALAATPARSKRSLHFDPLGVSTNQQAGRPPIQPIPHIQPPRLPMAQPAPNPRVKAAKFRGRSKEDVDCHVAQFETKWQASGYQALHNDQTKLQQFAATLEGKAMSWFSQYGVAHFMTYNALKAAFLQRFRKEKIPTDILKKIKIIRQKNMAVDDFAQKFRVLVERLQGNERPTYEMLAGYFLKGLRKELKNVVASIDIAAGFDTLVNVAARVEK